MSEVQTFAKKYDTICFGRQITKIYSGEKWNVVTGGEEWIVTTTHFLCRLLWKLQHKVVGLKRFRPFGRKLRYSKLVCLSLSNAAFHGLILHDQFQCLYIWKFWVSLLGMKLQMLWTSSTKLRVKINHFESWLRDCSWFRKKWFVFQWWLTYVILVLLLVEVNTYVVHNFYLRKKLFLRGVG